jgi:hypothetical protein
VTISFTGGDRVEFALFAARNPIADGSEGIEPILDVIDAHAGTLAPEVVDSRRGTFAYRHHTVRRVLDEQTSADKALDLAREGDPEAWLSMNFAEPDLPVRFWLRMTIPFSYFDEPAEAERRSQALVGFVRALAEACPPVYGYCHSVADLFLAEEPHQGDPMAPNRIHQVYWLNVLGASMVEELGRDRVLSTPATRVEELAGGALILTHPTPADFASEAARIAQALALAHLRDDVRFEEALAQLEQRSRALVPVTPDWDPDIADVLELIANVEFHLRPQEIARWNRYRPPEVTEWRPAADLLDADVDDPDAAVDRYEGLYAEQLAALLHKDVPEVMQATPDSLPPIDYHFWRFDYPGTFARDDIEHDLVPAIGGYLGMLLVRHLGGHWVPRADLDEAQVVVADRAWLPFLRARRYMQTRQSVLDYSLTKFFRTAERYANPRRGGP